MIGNVNALGMGQLGSKSPNLQSPPQSSLANNMGMNSMPMSVANNGTQPMSSMQGESYQRRLNVFVFFLRKQQPIYGQVNVK